VGDRWSLLLYSDGIYEGHVPGGSRLGIEGLLGLLDDEQGFDNSAPEGLIERVEGLNGGPLDDDVALLALTCNGDC
jgi:serine phosphatase RsbU (regulator of sigma subunit)